MITLSKQYSYTKRALLRELCENSRTPVTVLADKLKCSRNTVISNMKSLEKELGLHYTIEFDKDSLGLLNRHIWTVKFEEKPSLTELKKIFADDPFAQLVVATEGDFDLVVYVTADTGENYMGWGLHLVTKLLKYRPTIKPSMVAMRHMGYFPLQNYTIEKLRLETFDDIDRKLLLLLNQDSRLSYSALAKKMKEDVETIRYRMKRLVRRKVIKRFTTIVTKPVTDYNIAFFIEYDLAPGLAERYRKAMKYYVNLDGNIPIMNSYQYLALLSGSYLLFGLGCFYNEERAIKQAVIAHKELYREDDPRISFARITNVVRGPMPIRNINIAKEFVPIRWDK